jgi:non-ribosomal peptide synthetase component F
VATITKPGETTLDAFVVVLNEEGQHALWPAESDVPAGWRRASPVVPASEGVAAIDDAWPDVTPASVSAGRPPGPAAGRFAHEAFAGQAARHPEAAAVIAGRSRLTYRELEESASRLAGYLSEAGVAPETLVGVCLDRGADMILAILAIMKAGGGYLALDPSLPPDRLAQVCAQVRPAMVITDRAAPFPGAGARLLRLSDLAADLERRRPAAPAARARTTPATSSTHRDRPATPRRWRSATAAWRPSSAR